MTQNHNKFITHLTHSAEAVWLAARYLHSMGLTVVVNRTDYADTASEWKDYADNGDLEIITKSGRRERIEVKMLSASFHNQRTWPFPDFIVCEKDSFDRAEIKPYAYWIMSGDCVAVAIVRSSSASSWKVVRRKDSRYKDVWQEFYTCPLDQVEFKILNNLYILR
jgi:hypothetical protein